MRFFCIVTTVDGLNLAELSPGDLRGAASRITDACSTHGTSTAALCSEPPFVDNGQFGISTIDLVASEAGAVAQILMLAATIVANPRSPAEARHPDPVADRLPARPLPPARHHATPAKEPVPPCHRSRFPRRSVLHPSLQRLLRPALAATLPGHRGVPPALSRTFDNVDRELTAWITRLTFAA